MKDKKAVREINLAAFLYLKEKKMRREIISGYLNYKGNIKEVIVKTKEGNERVTKLLNFGISENSNLRFMTAWGSLAEEIYNISKGSIVLAYCNKYSKTLKETLKTEDGFEVLGKNDEPIHKRIENIVCKKIETNIEEIQLIQKQYEDFIDTFIKNKETKLTKEPEMVKNQEEKKENELDINIIAKLIIAENINEFEGGIRLKDISNKIMDNYLTLGFYFPTVEKCRRFISMNERYIDKTEAFIDSNIIYNSLPSRPSFYSNYNDELDEFKSISPYSVAMLHCKVEEYIKNTSLYNRYINELEYYNELLDCKEVRELLTEIINKEL